MVFIFSFSCCRWKRIILLAVYLLVSACICDDDLNPRVGSRFCRLLYHDRSVSSSHLLENIIKHVKDNQKKKLIITQSFIDLDDLLNLWVRPPCFSRCRTSCGKCCPASTSSTAIVSCTVISSRRTFWSRADGKVKIADFGLARIYNYRMVLTSVVSRENINDWRRNWEKVCPYCSLF